MKRGRYYLLLRDLGILLKKKFLIKYLKIVKKKYKQIINSSPNAIVIIVDNNIALVNYEACNLIGLDYNELVGSNVYKHFDEKFKKALHKRFRHIISQKKLKDTYDIEFCFSDGRLANLQISYSYIIYEGNPAILAVMRDVTEIKQELK